MEKLIVIKYELMHFGRTNKSRAEAGNIRTLGISKKGGTSVYKSKNDTE